MPDTFIDSSIWEKEKSKGATVIKNLIEDGLKKTSVTSVLIGTETAGRRWVKYEIVKSFERGNGLLAIHINRIKNKSGQISSKGLNPLDRLGFQVSKDGKKIHFFELVNRKWQLFPDFPEINNKKSNSIYFDDHWWRGNEFGEFFRFSDKFPTYCWKSDEGHSNFSDWIENAATKAGR
ncbi:hypothetical protein GCM10009118_16100 [Wandonia haliotis]|uniref:Thoeris protein ThsB TIR-like domain-containing protein n=2 Tax=Wandonia haliotis TaxID=574963 RepID=A0ABP3Y0Q5_9FLAO